MTNAFSNHFPVKPAVVCQPLGKIWYVHLSMSQNNLFQKSDHLPPIWKNPPIRTSPLPPYQIFIVSTKC